MGIAYVQPHVASTVSATNWDSTQGRPSATTLQRWHQWDVAWRSYTMFLPCLSICSGDILWTSLKNRMVDTSNSHVSWNWMVNISAMFHTLCRHFALVAEWHICFSSWLAIMLNIIWLVVWASLKSISQLGWLFPIYGKIRKTYSKPPTNHRFMILNYTTSVTPHSHPHQPSMKDSFILEIPYPLVIKHG